MADITYKVTPLSLTGKAAFSEASIEELRVLLALVELGGKAESEQELAALAKTSRARCISALAFWEEADVIKKSSDEPSITEEFEQRLNLGEIDEVPSLQVAKSIRDENLASMIEECATLIGVPSLPNADVKNLTALSTQYSLSSEFIVTLAAHLSSLGKLTTRKLCNNAIKLANSGCDTVEALERYIEKKAEENDLDWEFRRIFGIYNRNLSPSERKYFKKWSKEYGFSVAIISEAYDRAILGTSHGNLPYMDKILTTWHNAGCRSLAECVAHCEPKKSEAAPPKKPRKEPEPPRYGSFDINDAFKRALDRSYGTKDDES